MLIVHNRESVLQHRNQLDLLLDTPGARRKQIVYYHETDFKMVKPRPIWLIP